MILCTPTVIGENKGEFTLVNQFKEIETMEIMNGDLDAYSDVISVNYNKEMFDIFIGPSSLSINSTDIPIESIQIFNVLGQEIHNLRFEEIEKSTKFILDLDQLPTNTYIIRVNDIEGKMFIKYY